MHSLNHFELARTLARERTAPRHIHRIFAPSNARLRELAARLLGRVGARPGRLVAGRTVA